MQGDTRKNERNDEGLSEMIVNLLKISMAAEPEKKILELARRIQHESMSPKANNREQDYLE